MCSLLTMSLLSQTALLTRPAFGRRVAAPPPPPPLSPIEQQGHRAAAAAWLALVPPCLSVPKPITQELFGLDTTTFESNLREPAAGFIEITSPLFTLESGLLLALASSSLALSDEDRARAGAAIGLSSVGTLATLGLAAAQGLEVTNGPVVAAFVGLLVLTASFGAKATGAVEDPVALFKEDFDSLVDFGGDEEVSPNSQAAQLGFFYQSSVLVGLVVGASFLFSLISPISVFEAEAPVTHMLRQDLGVFIVFLLAPIQAALTRATSAGALGESTFRALNLLTGIACFLLVCDGKAQTDLGAATFAALEPGTEFYSTVSELVGDPAVIGRSVTNTNAAFTTGFAVASVYVFQAIFGKSRDEITARKAGRR